MKKTALIVSGLPGEANVGQLLLRDMLALLDPARISLVSLTSSGIDDSKADFGLNRVLVQATPSETARRKGMSGRIGTAIDLADRCTRYRTGINTAARDIAQFLKEQQPEQVWAILNSTAAIDVCWKLRAAIKGRLKLQVWDDPRHLMRQRNLDRLSINQTLRRFNQLLSMASAVGVISAEMAEAYRSRTRGELIVIRHGLSHVQGVRAGSNEAPEFRIGFSGAMYAESAWRAFQSALDQMGWVLGGRPVELVVVGPRIGFQSNAHAAARFLGWRSLDETLRLLSECDLLYLPQSFSALDEPLTRLSFPTKLSTYVATGRPVFLHTPNHGSLARFSREQEFGLLCCELDPQRIADSLQRLVEPDENKALAESSTRVARDVLSVGRFRQSVNEFLA